MDKSNDASWLGVVLMFALVIGWVINIVKLCMSLSEPLSVMLVFRCFGAVNLWLGGVIGWF